MTTERSFQNDGSAFRPLDRLFACAIHLVITTTSTKRCCRSHWESYTPRLIHCKTQTTYANNSEWIKPCQTDEKLLASYGGKVNREKNYDRHAKKKQKVLDEVFDDVDIFLANKISTHNTTICTNDIPPPQMAEEWRKLRFWDSGEAILLFDPIPEITTYATNTQ